MVSPSLTFAQQAAAPLPLQSAPCAELCCSSARAWGIKGTPRNPGQPLRLHLTLGLQHTCEIETCWGTARAGAPPATHLTPSRALQKTARRKSKSMIQNVWWQCTLLAKFCVTITFFSIPLTLECGDAQDKSCCYVVKEIEYIKLGSQANLCKI